jgi:2-keto-4-pentenoate hydratase
VSSDPRVAAGLRAALARREAELSAGARPLGWKIGINVPEVQRRLGLEAPVIGYLTTATELASSAERSLAGMTRPAVEPEVAVHLGGPVAADADPAAVRQAIAGLGAAIELVDVDLPFEDVETIVAGNVFHRGVIFGPPDTARAGGSLDGLKVRVTRNSAQEAAADVAEAGDDPVEVVRHVAGLLAPLGVSLEPGDRIIAGSLATPLPVEPGDSIEVEIDPLGSVRLALTA